MKTFLVKTLDKPNQMCIRGVAEGDEWRWIYTVKCHDMRIVAHLIQLVKRFYRPTKAITQAPNRDELALRRGEK